MHAIHHLPLEEHKRAFLELARTLKAGGRAAVVNGWYRPALMQLAEPIVRLGRLLNGRGKKNKRDWSTEDEQAGTFVQKMTPAWLRRELDGEVEFQMHPWRSLSPRVMRWIVRPGSGGRRLLRLIFSLEERFPGFFAEHGQYPVIEIRKPTP
jgi:hypothetical protein